MQILINVDVPDLPAAEAFYTAAFDLTVSHRFGGVVELTNGAHLIHLLEKPADSDGVAGQPRLYERHWTPLHLDIVVEDLDAAVARAKAAGARVESEPKTSNWGRIAMLADPFGHGFCLIQLLNRGYDELIDQA